MQEGHGTDGVAAGSRGEVRYGGLPGGRRNGVDGFDCLLEELHS